MMNIFLFMLVFMQIAYCGLNSINLKVSKTDKIDELVLEWKEVPSATAYFVKVYDTKVIPNHIKKIFMRGGDFGEGDLKLLQSMISKAVIALTDKPGVKIKNLKYREYYFKVSAAKQLCGRYYHKWIASSYFQVGRPKFDILSVFRKDKDIIIEPDNIIYVKIEELTKNIASYYGKVVSIEGKYVYSEDLPVILSDIKNYYYLTDGVSKIGSSQIAGLPTHPDTYKGQYDKESKKRFSRDIKEFQEKISGKYMIRSIGFIASLEDLPIHRTKAMKAEEEELWNELVFFNRGNNQFLKGLIYTYFSQNIGRTK